MQFTEISIFLSLLGVKPRTSGMMEQVVQFQVPEFLDDLSFHELESLAYYFPIFFEVPHFPS